MITGSPCWLIMMLVGFKSRCTTPRVCASCNASAAVRITKAVFRSAAGFPGRMYSDSRWPSMYAIVM